MIEDWKLPSSSVFLLKRRISLPLVDPNTLPYLHDMKAIISAHSFLKFLIVSVSSGRSSSLRWRKYVFSSYEDVPGTFVYTLSSSQSSENTDRCVPIPANGDCVVDTAWLYTIFTIPISCSDLFSGASIAHLCSIARRVSSFMLRSVSLMGINNPLNLK